MENSGGFLVRLDKLLANMGLGSRREVKELIKKKRVTVDENIARNGRIHVDPEQAIIKVDEALVTYQKYIYIMLNKAKGYISATRDAKEKTVIDLLPKKFRHFEPFPVGRLDKDTVGLLLLTNDGDLAHQLTSPNKEIEKTYYAKVKGKVVADDVQKFSSGVTLDDGYLTKRADLTVLKSDHLSEVEVTITEGKYHQVKRMFRAIGKEVVFLKRIRMGELILDESLPLGAYRELTEKELAYCESLK